MTDLGLCAFTMYIGSKNGVTILSKRSSYSVQNGCLSNPNGVPTRFFKTL